MSAATAIRYVGGPTAVIEYGGLALLLDPTFDPPGEYPVGDRVLTKTQGPARTVATPTGLGAGCVSSETITSPGTMPG